MNPISKLGYTFYNISLYIICNFCKPTVCITIIHMLTICMQIDCDEKSDENGKNNIKSLFLKRIFLFSFRQTFFFFNGFFFCRIYVNVMFKEQVALVVDDVHIKFSNTQVSVNIIKYSSAIYIQRLVEISLHNSLFVMRKINVIKF